jgi:hypothetical protein
MSNTETPRRNLNFTDQITLASIEGFDAEI